MKKSVGSWARALAKRIKKNPSALIWLVGVFVGLSYFGELALAIWLYVYFGLVALNILWVEPLYDRITLGKPLPTGVWVIFLAAIAANIAGLMGGFTEAVAMALVPPVFLFLSLAIVDFLDARKKRKRAKKGSPHPQ